MNMNLPNTEARERAKAILKGLERQKFADWYDLGAFEAYVSGSSFVEGQLPPTQDEILDDIVELFQLSPPLRS